MDPEMLEDVPDEVAGKKLLLDVAMFCLMGFIVFASFASLATWTLNTLFDLKIRHGFFSYVAMWIFLTFTGRLKIALDWLSRS